MLRFRHHALDGRIATAEGLAQVSSNQYIRLERSVADANVGTGQALTRTIQKPTVLCSSSLGTLL